MSPLDELPLDLPIPIDDGACDHLVGIHLPDLELSTTYNDQVNFLSLSGCVVIYIYPMTGRPEVTLPDGWDQIPGARGCTPQSCSFRDHYQEIEKLNATVYGLSTQSTDYQLEAANRLHLPFPLVSDVNLEFITNLSLPTIKVEGMVLSKRITIIAYDGIIKKVFYPVFPPNENANQVIGYLNEQQI
ncbi:MAG: peroxiredoxin [Pseudomonadales bacterium]|nr:peroxiredoxin [Pseudomonadales bacterium]